MLVYQRGKIVVPPENLPCGTCTKRKVSSDKLFLRVSHVAILLLDDLPFLSSWWHKSHQIHGEPNDKVIEPLQVTYFTILYHSFSQFWICHSFLTIFYHGLYHLFPSLGHPGHRLLPGFQETMSRRVTGIPLFQATGDFEPARMRWFNWLACPGKITGKPHISWENPWFPLKIFPSTNPLNDRSG